MAATTSQQQEAPDTVRAEPVRRRHWFWPARRVALVYGDQRIELSAIDAHFVREEALEWLGSGIEPDLAKIADIVSR